MDTIFWQVCPNLQPHCCEAVVLFMIGQLESAYLTGACYLQSSLTQCTQWGHGWGCQSVAGRGQVRL